MKTGTLSCVPVRLPLGNHCSDLKPVRTSSEKSFGCSSKNWLKFKPAGYHDGWERPARRSIA